MKVAPAMDESIPLEDVLLLLEELFSLLLLLLFGFDPWWDMGVGMNDNAEIVWSCPLKVRTHVYVEKSHSLILRSEDEDARCDPVGVNDRECTVLVCPLRVRTYSPLS